MPVALMAKAMQAPGGGLKFVKKYAISEFLTE
jgi:hypothetical protein